MRTRVVNVKQEQADVYVGRPSKWGNPFIIGKDGDRDEVVSKYRSWLLKNPELVRAARAELKGKSLGCHCAPLRCHADVLVEAAESGPKPSGTDGRLKRGDIWSASGHILIPCNNVLVEGTLVMGAGLALQARQRYPGLAQMAGYAISEKHAADYHLIFNLAHSADGSQHIGIIQTKRNWKDASPLDLVRKSIKELSRAASMRPDEQFHSVVLGSGHGGLDASVVLEAMKGLPDNVTIWQP